MRSRKKFASGDAHSASTRFGIAGTDLGDDEARLVAWLASGRHGTMDYMARHGVRRARPSELVPVPLTVITARLNYLPPAARASDSVLADPAKAFVARYALGRDYHKVLRAKLERLAGKIRNDAGAFGYRVFTDSAPVLEVALAANSGLGWRGKHTLLLTRDAGSWFFLGEIYTSLLLPQTPPQTAHCGSCTACIDVSRRTRSSARTSSMRAAASRISRSSTWAAFPRTCGR